MHRSTNLKQRTRLGLCGGAAALLVALLASPVRAAAADEAQDKCAGGLPVFEAQPDAEEGVRFLARSPGANLTLAYNGATLTRLEPAGAPAEIRMRLLGMRWHPYMAGLEEAPRSDPRASTNRPACRNVEGALVYEGVRYREVYPGIDMVYYPGRGGFEFDFVLSPGADPRPIQFVIEGVRRLETDRLGNIHLRLPGALGSMKLLRPSVYQTADGVRRPIAGAYVVRGRRIGFEVGTFDRREPLIIDPVLVYTSRPVMAQQDVSGVFKSEDGGRTWQATGLDDRGVRAVAIDTADPAVIYAGTEGSGIYRSSDGGRTWLPRNAGLGNLYVNAISLDPAPPGRVHAATASGLFVSVDDGASWRAAGPRLHNPVYRAVASDPALPRTHYAADDVRVAKTMDDGVSWTWSTVAGDYVTSLAIDPVMTTTVYAGVFYATPRGGGVYRSFDGGWSWRLVSASVVGPSGRQYDINALAVAPAAGASIVYAGTGGGGVYKSIDNGNIWTAANSGLGSVSVSALAVDPRDSSTIFAAVENRGIFKSTDAGTTWTETTAGLGLRLPSALAIDPGQPDRIYAGLRARRTGAGSTGTATLD